MTRAVATPTTYELRRSLSNRKLGGVLGGFADHFGIDATLLRVVYLLSSVFSAAFPGVLVYLVLWVMIPAERPGDELTDEEFYDYPEDEEDYYLDGEVARRE